ncbi:predicted FEN-1 endonuclease [Squirrelpox virus]|uniref:Predicted FEN-1 endonuclease n=1 Tax=Squirrelpox virus TaxID=240426 RepID=U3UBH4_9POXV|nr:predicted FEN-1 endonuclease [Squirrelpox virus]CCD83231.1 predicted FEN-1 endonuclease [Squirrelpox virus]
MTAYLYGVLCTPARAWPGYRSPARRRGTATSRRAAGWVSFMGVKNLLAVLSEHGSVTEEPGPGGRFPAVFVDSMSIFRALAYFADCRETLRLSFVDLISQLLEVGDRVVLFVDSGQIPIKDELRARRRQAAARTVERQEAEIVELERLAEARRAESAAADDMLDRGETEAHARALKLRFQVTAAAPGAAEALLAEVLRHPPPRTTVVAREGVDAELEMCRRALEEAAVGGAWPLLVSTDQDTVLMATADRLPKVVRTASKWFRVLPTLETEYLAKLTVLVNGCDFFAGLAGVQLDRRALARAALFGEFTAYNAARSVVALSKGRPRGSGDEAVDAEAIVSFVNRYAGADPSIYEGAPPGASARGFALAGLAAAWRAFRRWPEGASPLAAMILGLEPRRAISPGELDTLARVERFYRAKPPSREAVAAVAAILGYSTAGEGEVVMALVDGRPMARHEDGFYFNASCIIENAPGTIDIVRR